MRERKAYVCECVRSMRVCESVWVCVCVCVFVCGRERVRENRFCKVCVEHFMLMVIAFVQSNLHNIKKDIRKQTE